MNNNNNVYQLSNHIGSLNNIANLFKNKAGIYIFTNNTNGKCYIGSSDVAVFSNILIIIA